MASHELISFKRIYKKDKLTQLLKTHDYADCVFVCCNERIPAHKLILACSSPVFESMFYGQLAERNEIELPDINPEDLKKMLEYVYTDHTHLASVDSAWKLIYICKKYLLSDLMDICVYYVEKNLNVGNLLMSFEYAQLYDQRELIQVCKEDITKFTKGLLFNSEYHMKGSTLSFILEQCVINASESDIVMIAVKWAMEECTLKDLDVNQENICIILKDNKFLERVKFSEFDVAQYKLTLGLLNTGLYYDISYFSKFILDSYCSKEMGNVISSRTAPKLLNYKHRDSYRISKNLVFFNAFQINSVIIPSRPVYLFGIGVTTMRTPERAVSCTYVGTVEVMLTCNSQHYYNYVDLGRTMQYDAVHFVNFPLPLTMDRGNLYRIFITYHVESLQEKGEVLLHYLCQRLIEKTSGTMINFSDELEGSVIRAVCFYPA